MAAASSVINRVANDFSTMVEPAQADFEAALGIHAHGPAAERTIVPSR